MTMTGRSILLALLAVLGCSPAALGEDERWTTYRNDRFGTTVDYPDLFALLDRPPDNGDGQVFRTRDRRATLTVFGRYNVLGETPREMMEGRREAGAVYTVQNADASGYTLSFAHAGQIVYARCRLSPRDPEIVGCAELDYPEADARRWDGIVGRLARSLRF